MVATSPTCSWNARGSPSTTEADTPHDRSARPSPEGRAAVSTDSRSRDEADAAHAAAVISPSRGQGGGPA